MTAACGVRAPRPLDVAALVRSKGAVEARRDLEVHVLDSPRDVQARLALAKLADEAKRPSQALEQLEAVLRLGGPLGTRWHDEDKARFARLLAARGRIRLGRGSPTALADLERARGFGAAVTADELERARAASAVWDLRHVDAELRERGRAAMAKLADASWADHSWLGAKPDPVPRNRGLWGVWLWEHGARRAAWEALRDWHAITPVRGGELHEAYLRAYAWWTPYDGPPPPADDLVGPGRCRYATAPMAASPLVPAGIASECSPSALLARGDSAAVDAVGWSSPSARTADPLDAAAWAEITLVRALRGEGSWGPMLAGRVDLAALDRAKLPAFVRPVFGQLTGNPTRGIDDSALGALGPGARLVVAAERVLDGAPVVSVRVALADLAETDEGRALLAIAEPPVLAPTGEVTSSSGATPARSGAASPSGVASRADSTAVAIAAYVRARGHGDLDVASIVTGYAVDPGSAERLARDAVAEAGDAAGAQAAVGTTFSLLGDPARARIAWQAAVDLSSEPDYVRGLAEACARAGDPDAALVHGTTAAAASGDPAVVWIELARALADVGKHVHALEAARYAIDLAGADTIAPALEVAIASSRALGRDAQATELALRRATVAPAVATAAAEPAPPTPTPATPTPAARTADGDPTDARAALAASSAPPDDAFDRLWIAARWNPRDVAVRARLLAAWSAPDAEPRVAVIVRELVALASDRDSSIGRAAVGALVASRAR